MAQYIIGERISGVSSRALVLGRTRVLVVSPLKAEVGESANVMKLSIGYSIILLLCEARPRTGW